jgi:hypothetical protein
VSEQILGYAASITYATGTENQYLTVAERMELVGRIDVLAAKYIPLVRTREFGDGKCWLAHNPRTGHDFDFITADRHAMYGYLEQGYICTTLTLAHINPSERDGRAE